MPDTLPQTEVPNTPELIIRAPTEEEEYQYLCARISRKTKRGSVSPNFRIPEHPLIQKILGSPPGLDAVNQEEFRLVHQNEMYDPTVYQAALENIEKVRDTIQSAFEVFQELQQQWGFMVFEQYTIRLSRYVGGGSYGYKPDGSSATAIISAKKTGDPNRSSFAEIPIHEFIHCGIETPIIRPFHLEQEEKERVVDLLIIHSLQEILPEYKVDSAPSRIDDFVTSSTIAKLPEAMTEYTRTVPRER